MLGQERAVLGDLTLAETLSIVSGLQDNIVLINFPKTIALRLDSNHEEVDRDVASLGDLLVLLHETNDQVGLLGDRDAELRVVKPLVVRVDLDDSVLGLFIGLGFDGVRTASRVTAPLAMNRVLRPGRREDLTQVDLVEVGAEVLELHPPVTVIFENII